MITTILITASCTIMLILFLLKISSFQLIHNNALQNASNVLQRVSFNLILIANNVDNMAKELKDIGTETKNNHLKEIAHNLEKEMEIIAPYEQRRRFKNVYGNIQ